MRAVTIADFGADPELIELPVPELGPTEILIRIEAAAVNPFDWKVIDGALKDFVPHTFPLILGNDAAGVVERAGADVTRFQPGDRVCGQFMSVRRGRGAYAEYAVAAETGFLAILPPELPFAVAAALPTAGMSAYNAVDATCAASGQTILINGATGGVGQFAVQFAAQRGLRVIATAGQDMADYLRELGAAEIVDRAQGNTVDQVQAAYPKGIDAVLDLVSGPADALRVADLLALDGIFISTVGGLDQEALTAKGVVGMNFSNKSSTELLETLVAMASSGTLRVRIDAEVPLAQVAATASDLRTRRARGKTVILPR
ncbi:MAG: NADP-dependent oxidoreductase [Nocardia sp.]|uniref:NADP-dependent oxidoreductase n=1 Tax=Nocardia sp. TaxID=1821 RepID=UPI00262CE2D8|nr:NADP-dependent oxidoreductase [Nocardia sp.]MCU1644881.1 NADP-dependent oxidoreductase [Nocardia sp.]